MRQSSGSVTTMAPCTVQAVCAARTHASTLKATSATLTSGVTAATFDAGADPQSLIATGRRSPTTQRLVESDATELMSGALLYDVTLAPGERRTFGWMAPLSGEAPTPVVTGSVEAMLDGVEDRVAAGWRQKLDRVDLILPPEAQRIEDVLRSSLATRRSCATCSLCASRSVSSSRRPSRLR